MIKPLREGGDTTIMTLMFRRYFWDLRLRGHRQAALDWFERGECYCWCCACGMDYDAVMERVEVEMAKRVYRY